MKKNAKPLDQKQNNDDMQLFFLIPNTKEFANTNNLVQLVLLLLALVVKRVPEIRVSGTRSSREK